MKNSISTRKDTKRIRRTEKNKNKIIEVFKENKNKLLKISGSTTK